MPDATDAPAPCRAAPPDRPEGLLRPHHARTLAAVPLAALLATAPAVAQRMEIVVVRDSAAVAVPTAADPDAPPPARGLTWRDTRDDAGRSVELAWEASPADDGGGAVLRYVVERAPTPGGPWAAVDSVPGGVTALIDATVRRDTDYFYRVTTVGPLGRAPARSVTGPVAARSEWFHGRRANVLALLLPFFVLVLAAIARTQGGRTPFVRRIPGIDAIEEAIGRATETRRPVLFVPGISDIDEIQTVAGLVVLESVARLTARHETPIVVPVSHPIPLAIAEEMVRAGCAHAGRPDAYDPDSVRFVSPEQFAYVAAVTGILMRERPAAVLYMGSFFGESLLLAETGHAAGAIQIAATANVHQLPFFVAACDHTLIGEELFAAGAYLSGDPRLVGSLKGADTMKVLVIVLVLAGCVLETFGMHGLSRLMETQ
jgi:hypothetical protein